MLICMAIFICCIFCIHFSSTSHLNPQNNRGITSRTFTQKAPPPQYRLFSQLAQSGALAARALTNRTILSIRFVFQHLDRDGGLAAQALIEDLGSEMPTRGPDCIEILENIFFRNKAAYVIGRIRVGERIIPMVMVLLHPGSGIVLDAVLTSDPEVSTVFTSARSNFHVKEQLALNVHSFAALGCLLGLILAHAGSYLAPPRPSWR